jgi:hypothetical protein
MQFKKWGWPEQYLHRQHAALSGSVNSDSVDSDCVNSAFTVIHAVCIYAFGQPSSLLTLNVLPCCLSGVAWGWSRSQKRGIVMGLECVKCAKV